MADPRLAVVVVTRGLGRARSHRGWHSREGFIAPVDARFGTKGNWPQHLHRSRRDRGLIRARRAAISDEVENRESCRRRLGVGATDETTSTTTTNGSALDSQERNHDRTVKSEHDDDDSLPTAPTVSGATLPQAIKDHVA